MATFGLIAGGCHNAWCWSRLIPELQQRGHEAVAVNLPTDRSDAGLRDYAGAVGEALNGSSGDVVLVGHSAAGRYLPLAAGLVPGARIVFLCALIPEQGAPVGTGPRRGGGRFVENGRLKIPRDQARELFYSECDEATASWALDRLHEQTMSILTEPFPDGGWPEGLMCAFICCTGDRVSDPARAREQAVAHLGVAPVEIPGDHSPFLSRPATLSDALAALLIEPEHWGTHRRASTDG